MVGLPPAPQAVSSGLSILEGDSVGKARGPMPDNCREKAPCPSLVASSVATHGAEACSVAGHAKQLCSQNPAPRPPPAGHT